MPFAQINATPNNGKVTLYHREGSFWKTTDGKLPAVRVTAQDEIDAFYANRHSVESYEISVEQQAKILGQPASAVKYPTKPKPDDVDDITFDEAAGVTIPVNGEASVKTVVLRIAVVGGNGAEMFVAADGNFVVKTINGVDIKAGDRLSITFAYFNGTYTTVDAALSSLEKWHWCTPYIGHTVTAAP